MYKFQQITTQRVLMLLLIFGGDGAYVLNTESLDVNNSG